MKDNKYITSDIFNGIEKTIRGSLPNLISNDYNFLLKLLTSIIKLILVKSYDEESMNKIKESLLNNNNKELISVFYILLPFINVKANKDEIYSLEQLSIEKINNDDISKSEVKYKFTNIQYDRCFYKNEIKENPLKHNDILDNYYLLCYTIDNVFNKLYVNWITVLPDYDDTSIFDNNSQLYKLNSIFYKVNNKKDYKDIKSFIDSKLKNYNFKEELFIDKNSVNDISNKLTISDIYNTSICNVYLNNIEFEWLIYILPNNHTSKGLNISFFLQQYIIDNYKFIDEVIYKKDNKWKQLSNFDRFTLQKVFNEIKNKFLNNNFDKVLNFIVTALVYNFNRFYKNLNKIRRDKYINIDLEYSLNELLNRRDLVVKTLSSIELEHFYNYIYSFIDKFTKSYYYSFLEDAYNSNSNYNIINVFNIHQLCKAMYYKKYTNNKVNQKLNKYYYSNTSDNIKLIIKRLNNFFLLGSTLQSFEKVTPWENDENVFTNKNRSEESKKKLRLYFYIFITNVMKHDGIYSRLSINSDFLYADKLDYSSTKISKLKKISENYLTKFSNNNINISNYFLKNTNYKNLGKIKFKNKKKGRYITKDYIEYLYNEDTSPWYTQYALNWVSQISFFHRYLNNRVIFITGSTGVGKSTQMPKLLLYSLKAIDRKNDGKIICTQPRIPPTETVTRQISEQMGIPISNYYENNKKDIPTDEFILQFKHSVSSHINSDFDMFLKLVTDGTLYQEIKNNILMKKRQIRNEEGKIIVEYTTDNIYDIIIVDESHEHNVNMDLIITLLKYSLYYNNKLKLVIISATMDSDEASYRRFFRSINDNRMYPLNTIIQKYNINRLNVDRRVHISPPGVTTKFKIKEFYYDLDNKGDDKIIREKIINIIVNELNNKEGDILIFRPTMNLILKLVDEINKNNRISNNTIALPYFGGLSESKRKFIEQISDRKSELVMKKVDSNGDPVDYLSFDENDNVNLVSKGTYSRVIIIATNVAEASITIPTLKFVIETGTQKIVVYNSLSGESENKIVSIDEKSREQRRGRVGRVGPGTVYYLYKEGSKENIRSSFNITTQDISESIYNLLNDKINDKYLFDKDNDPNFENNINKLKLNNLKAKYKNNIDKMIEEQYFIDGIFYDYFGNFYYNKRPMSFYENGFNLKTVIDNNGEFYIIHPNENDFNRNILGEIVSINDNTDVKILEEFSNKITINSNKMNSMLKQLKNNLYLVYDIENNIHIKTLLGKNINIFNLNTLKFFDNKLLLTFIYSIGYKNSEEIIKLLPFLMSDKIQNISSLVSSKNFFKNLKKFKFNFRNDYGDIYTLHKIMNDLLGQLSYPNKLDDLNKLNELKKELRDIKIDYLNKYKDNFEKIDKDKFEGINIYIKLNKLYLNNELFNSNDIEDDIDILLLNDLYEDYLTDNIISKKNNKSIISTYCKINYLNENLIMDLIKDYNKLLNILRKLENDIYEIDYDNIENNINFEWLENNLKYIINKGKSSNYELLIKPLLHSYGSNIVYRINNSPFYMKVLYPDPELFAEIVSDKNKDKNKINLFTTIKNISFYNYLFYLKKNNNYLSFINYVNPEWLLETNQLMYSKNNFKKNMFIITNVKKKLRTLVSELSSLKKDDEKEKLIKILKNDVIGEYLIGIDKIINNMVKNNKLNINKIINYLNNVEKKINTDIIDIFNKMQKNNMSGGGLFLSEELNLNNDNYIIYLINNYIPEFKN